MVFNENKVLLVKRGHPPAEGQWAIPGGRVHLGETLQQAAEREILEETGVTIAAGKPVYTFDVVQRDARGRVQFHYVIVDLRAEYISGRVQAGDDASDARWVAAEQFAEMDINPRTRTFLWLEFGFGTG